MKGDEYRSGFSATGTLLRSEFGMNYILPHVGDKIDIRIEVEGIAIETTKTKTLETYGD
jgi:polyisoprenoid-binding protein YceI